MFWIISFIGLIVNNPPLFCIFAQKIKVEHIFFVRSNCKRTAKQPSFQSVEKASDYFIPAYFFLLSVQHYTIFMRKSSAKAGLFRQAESSLVIKGGLSLHFELADNALERF